MRNLARVARIDVGDHVFHVLHRAVGRFEVFKKEADYLSAAARAAVAQEYDRKPQGWVGWCRYLFMGKRGSVTE